MAIIRKVTCPDGKQRAFHSHSVSKYTHHGFVKIRILGKRISVTGTCTKEVFTPSPSAHFLPYFYESLSTPELRRLLNLHLSDLASIQEKILEDKEIAKEKKIKEKEEESSERTSEKLHKEGRGKSKRVS